MLKVALKGLLGRKLRACADGARHRARRRDDQRHLRPDRHDQGGLHTIFTIVVSERRRRGHRQERLRRATADTRSVVPGSRLLAKVRGAARGRRGCRRRRRRPTHTRRHERQGDRARRRARTSASASTPAATSASTRSTLVAGHWPGRPARGRDRHSRPRQRSTSSVGDKIGVSVQGPMQAVRITGIVKFGGVASLGGATLAIFDLPTAQKLFEKAGSARRDRRRGEAGESAPSCSARSARPAAARPGAHRRRSRRKQESDTTQFLSSSRSSCSPSAGSRSSSAPS